jgi:flagellar biosynthesis protein FliP
MSRLRPWLRLLLAALVLVLPMAALAQDAPGELGSLADGVGAVVTDAATDEVDAAVRLLVLLTSLSLIPAILVLMTPFTRFIIVFALLRQALGLQQSPPNQVLIGLAFMLSMVVMQPTLDTVQAEALDPYLAGEITTVEAMEEAIGPMRGFMLDNMEPDDLKAAMRVSRMTTRPETVADIPTPVVVTGFVLSELRASFVIGIKVYLPFLVLDIIVASVLLGMGMMMIPPVVISMPFKLMLFVLMDGWGLLVTGLVSSYG